MQNTYLACGHLPTQSSFVPVDVLGQEHLDNLSPLHLASLDPLDEDGEHLLGQGSAGLPSSKLEANREGMAGQESW